MPALREFQLATERPVNLLRVSVPQAHRDNYLASVEPVAKLLVSLANVHTTTTA